MSDTTVQLQQDGLQQKQDLSGSLVAELAPDVVITTTPGRRKWTALETADLIDGCVKYGVGNWKRILTDSQFNFHGRSAVDLKDRFRTVYPSEYKRLYPGSKRVHERKKSPDIQAPKLTRVRRRERRAFTTEEDEMLLKGVEKHGVAWAKIARDEQFNLAHRTSTDLRDRFRNAFPEKYDMYGYSPRQKRKSGSHTRNNTADWAKMAQQSQQEASLNNQRQVQVKDQRTDSFTEEDVSVIYRASYDPERGLTATHNPSEHAAGFRHLIHRPENSWMSDDGSNPTLTYPSLTDTGYTTTIAPGDTSSIDALSDHVAQMAQQQPEASIDLIRSISDL
ncbi:hypothetical protein INT44_003934, partial [Umbelopsis vinacea]